MSTVRCIYKSLSLPLRQSSFWSYSRCCMHSLLDLRAGVPTCFSCTTKARLCCTTFQGEESVGADDNRNTLFPLIAVYFAWDHFPPVVTKHSKLRLDRLGARHMVQAYDRIGSRLCSFHVAWDVASYHMYHIALNCCWLLFSPPLVRRVPK